MFRQLAHRHDRNHVQKSLDRQKRIADHCLSFSNDQAIAFLINELSGQYAPKFDLASWSISEGEQFYSPLSNAMPLEVSETGVTFESDLATADRENNTFGCRITQSGSKDHAVVVFHHWYARNRHARISKFFASKGITVVEATLPYHHHRGTTDFSEEKFLSADIGRTVRSIRQAVLDGRKVVGWLHEEGYKRISVAGMCIGGTVAGLIAAHDNKVDSAVLVVSPISPANLVWTSETMHALRDRIGLAIGQEDLKSAWSIIDLEKHTFGLTRKGLKLMFIVGEDDTIARPDQSKWLIDFLNMTNRSPKVVRLRCGHSSLGLFPYNFIAAWQTLHFLKDWPTPRELWDLRHLMFGFDLTEGPPKYAFFRPVAQIVYAMIAMTLYCVDVVKGLFFPKSKNDPSQDGHDR